jgi:hypothetical protein
VDCTFCGYCDYHGCRGYRLVHSTSVFSSMAVNDYAHGDSSIHKTSRKVAKNAKVKTQRYLRRALSR